MHLIKIAEDKKLRGEILSQYASFVMESELENRHEIVSQIRRIENEENANMEHVGIFKYSR